jgi:hypothetical protein
MVCAFSFLRALFSSRKKSRSKDLSAPPEYRQICNEQVDVKSQTICEPQLLNPNLRFTASELEVELSSKDVRFAAAVVELMLPRLTLGVWHEPIGWGHYSFPVDKVGFR